MTQELGRQVPARNQGCLCLGGGDAATMVQCAPEPGHSIVGLLAQTAVLTEQVRLFEAVLDNMSQGLCMFDAQSRLVVSNRRYCELFGISPEAIGPGMTQEQICNNLIAQGCYPTSVTLDEIRGTTRVALQRDDDPLILRELADGRTLSILYRVIAGGGWISTFEDVTERKRSDARITHLARHDAMTDLANTHAMRGAYRDLSQAPDPDRPLLGLCYVDLDRFKLVNDTYGHAVGDELLRIVAERLRASTRNGDIVARLGGDEFMVVQRVSQEASVIATAQRLISVLAEPYEVSTARIVIGASVGVAIRGAGAADIDPILHDADLALRNAKVEGRGTIRIFDVGMSEAARARQTLEAELHSALTSEQFEVHYQPLVEVGQRQIVGVEALVRWRHPSRGLVPPIDFITVLEEIGLIVPMGRWVLERACRDAMRWPDHIVVAVNVSSVQMRQKSFADHVLAILSETGLPHNRLEIEITESALLEETEITLENMVMLHAAGIRLAMDDFGTGYSSLSYLRRFPIDKIKIDRSFMKDAEISPDARAIIRAVAGLGLSLGITTLVEGVETQQQFDLARAEGVDQVQGYLFSRPQPEAAISEMIARKDCRRSEGWPI